MANIIRHGKTPKWGVEHNIQGLIIDSFSTSTEIKDYEQTDEKGAVCGYLVYDQTKNFDFSATVLADITAPCIHSDIGNIVTNFASIANDQYYNQNINSPKHAILKSLSVSETAGGATTLSGSGTIYAFEVEADCNN